MAFSSNSKKYYHVFLSFRGADVRKNFLGHLYAALDQRGLNTFMDDEELRKGEEISPALMRAIEESRIAIIIFSENYASSRWCLEELAKIMECKEQDRLIVFPVFYKVEPREVRWGRESYRRAIARHESKFGKNSEKVKKWKKTLFDAGSLSGWDLKDRDEAELIQSIIEKLSICLSRRPLEVTKYLVDEESRVQELIWLSQKESAGSDVLMIGLWGPGGIGKTTIAKALFNAIEKQFQGCSFLERVRERSNPSDGLVALQKQLLSEILPHKELTVYGVSGGISLIRDRLCRKKVLLVLDDVDEMDQLNALVGKGDWFGKGSRIIVTTRDKHLLTSKGINCVYAVENLGDNEARVLFSQHAFPYGKSVEIRRDLIDRALHYANGLPLALEVLGSSLCNRNEATWESALDKLSTSPDKTINKVLKTSFDGLDQNERNIFLDIACFFKGMSTKYIQEVFDSCGFHTTIGIEILIERSLIKNEYGALQMHDLIQLMGKDIVNQKDHNNPGNRTRLWLFEDVQDVLCTDLGTDAIQAIVLDSSTPKEMTINPNAFTKMKMLRMLILHEVHISSQGPICLPNALRCLEWPNAPDLEFGPSPNKLTKLHFRNSPIKQLGGNCQNLKSIEFINCNSLASIPDFSSAPHLESLCIQECEHLEEVHQSMGYLDKLKLLKISHCSNLRIFPNTLKTKSLQELHLCHCSKLEKFPDILEKMEHLIHFDIKSIAIKELPASIENLVSVVIIKLSNCKNLMRLPSSIQKMKNLGCLYLDGCSNLAMFPKILEDSIDPENDVRFPSLKYLDLSASNLSEFLENASSFPELTELKLSSNRFTHLPTSINNYDNWKDVFVYRRKQSKGELPKKQAVDIIQSGREMPDWFLDGKEGYISFMIPRDMCDEFLGLALSVVLSLGEGKAVALSCEVRIFFNCQEVARHTRYFPLLESDHVWLYYVPRSKLNGVEKLQRNYWSYIQVYASSSKGSIKKCGFRLICEQKEDDLRGVFPTPSADRNKLKFLREDSDEDNSIDTVEEDATIETDGEESASPLTKKRRQS
ncbi:hypothetical protein BT93_L4137 [Corymbia citriodora subsp. variegata]|uniref:ADP-ribosyl cyclase/cyclic ADP-ribose hydrolase n=1 Tax=Corymbia citriodora subsp. variegata TaxID=360336 RepID=A0A8T0CYM2_CORYI|nr:hypothetical protein BT93_L4137 [Corymbia citriodora subsp. variegata]